MGLQATERWDENPIPPPDQGEVGWGLSSIFTADYREGEQGVEGFFPQPVSAGAGDLLIAER